MTRWSLSNKFFSVSHKQFRTYALQFKQAVEQSFGGECCLRIKVLNSPKLYTTFWDEAVHNGLSALNESHTLLETEHLDDITPGIWEKSAYVELFLSPAKPKEAPNSAFAHAEFKGTLPKQATFYVQPDGEDARQSMLSSNSGRIIGDGFESNGVRTGSFFNPC